jgi:hypothetical protein
VGVCNMLVCVCVCVCVYGFCIVWMCVYVGFVKCGRFGNCVGVLLTCVLVFTLLYCLYCVFALFRLCTFILICFVCTGVRTTATERQLNCS